MSRTFRHRLASSHFITYLTVFTFEGKSSWVPIHLKDILHASQGQVWDVLGPMNHYGSSTTFTKNCLHFTTGRSQDPWHLGKLPGGSFIYPGNRPCRVKPAVDAICRRVTTDIRHLIRAWGIRWAVRFQSPRALPPIRLFVGKRETRQAGRSHTRDSRMESPVPTQLKGICASLISPAGFTRRGDLDG